MRHGRRRRALPAADERRPEPTYSDLCWLLALEDDGVALAEVRITTGRLVLSAKPMTQLYPGDQELRRLAQIDLETSDVQLLFVDTANVLDLTRLRFATGAKAQIFVSQLVEEYERSVGDTFPQSGLQVHRSHHLGEREI